MVGQPSTLHRLVRRPPLAECWPRPSVMGVVNVTPDSFSDGGDNIEPTVAVAAARRLLAEGAALVDIGGESTRPGADAVTVDEELRRVLPVLEGLSGLPVSIDTSKAEVARRALELGATFVNDVSALRADPDLAGVIADADAYVCLMHMQGEPRTMQLEPRYEDVVGEVAGFLEERLAAAVAAGIPEEHVCLDPGIGFGKTADQNLELIRGLERICRIGRPVLVGLSRKSTLARVARRSVGAGRHRRCLRRCGGGSVRPRGGAVPGPRRRVPRAGPRRRGGRRARERRVTIELYGIVLHGFHGVLEEERREGQRFLVDVELDLEHEQAARSDRIEDAVDYREIVARVRHVSEARSYHLLEAFTAAIADALVAGWPVTAVRVRVRKPDVVLDPPVEYAAVSVERRRL